MDFDESMSVIELDLKSEIDTKEQWKINAIVKNGIRYNTDAQFREYRKFLSLQAYYRRKEREGNNTPQGRPRKYVY